jgi:hypothetical protein
MAGEIFSIHGPARYSFVGFGQADLKNQVSLRSSDGQVFALDGKAAALSGRLRRLAQQGELEGEIDMPLQGDVVSKLVEYLEYHKQVPSAEIVVPLESDNLAECGALKWDAAFINVEKDMVFQLLLAAIVEDIPSLMSLASAKAHLMLKGKSPAKLCKDFAMVDDMPREEEEENGQLTSGFLNAMMKQRMYVSDMEGLPNLAAAFHGLVTAAQKNGLLESSKEGNSLRHQSWRTIALADYQQLYQAPPEVRGDRELMLACCKASGGQALQLATDDLKADKAVVLEAAKAGGASFVHAAPELQADREFVMEAILASDGSALKGASTALQADQELMLEAAQKGRGAAMQGASPALQGNRAFVLVCTSADPEAFKYASPDLRGDRGFTLEAVQSNGLALRFAAPKFQADREVVKAAVAQNGEALGFAHTSRRAEFGQDFPEDTAAKHVQEKEQQDMAGIGRPSDEDMHPTVMMEQVTLSRLQEGSRVAGARDDSEREVPRLFLSTRVQKHVQFTAMSTMTANMGQSNYCAANSWLDKLMFYERPELDGVGLMWGAVGGIGMRWKAFASQDFLTSEAGQLLSVVESRMILYVAACCMDPPEWFTANHFDDYSRQGFLAPSAGFGTGGGWKPGMAPVGWGDGWGEDALPAGGAGTNWSEWKNLAAGGDKQTPPPSSTAPPAPAARGPLGSWPGFAKDTAAGKAGTSEEELQEGARVRLVGCGSKDGSTGVLVKRAAIGGKWKVKLDDGQGHALLPQHNLVALPPAPDAPAPLAD